MFRFQLEVSGEMLLDRGIQRFSEACDDYRPIWPVLAEEFYELEKKQFATEGEEGGGEKWAELSPDYAKWKELHFPGKPILQRSGDLVSSLTSRTDPNAVFVEEAKKLTLGSRIPYAVYHQSPRPRKALPRRPPIMFPERFKRDAMKHLQAHLVRMASAQGLRGYATGDAARRMFQGIAERKSGFRRAMESGRA